MQVAVSDIPEGSVVQLHVRDPQWAQSNILKQLQVRCMTLLGGTLCYSIQCAVTVKSYAGNEWQHITDNKEPCGHVTPGI